MHQEEHQGVTLRPLGRASLAETVNTVSLVFVSCGCNQYLSCVCFCLYMCLQLARSLSLSLFLSLSLSLSLRTLKAAQKIFRPEIPKAVQHVVPLSLLLPFSLSLHVTTITSMIIIVPNILKKISSKKLHPRSDDRMDPKGSLLHKDTRNKLLQQKEKAKKTNRNTRGPHAMNYKIHMPSSPKRKQNEHLSVNT